MKLYKTVMKNKIDSFKKYKDEYKKSVQNPELFWKQADQFSWEKNGIQF